MNIGKLLFKIQGDDKGSLVSVEGNSDIPFPIRRVYYLYGIKQDVIRGHHAHKTLQQVIISVHGSCKIRLDDGEEQQTEILCRPNEGIYISYDIWRELYDFSSDAVLVVLASDSYYESDYIRDYDEFLQYLKRHKNVKPETG